MARVLYVEDHGDTRDAISHLLRVSGYEVDTAADGREALNLAIEKTPEVILLDLAMPQMNGPQLVQILRSYHRLATIPIVVLSALHTGELVEQTELLSVSCFLVKSYATIDKIDAALQDAMAHRRLDNSTRTQEKWRDDQISPL